MNFFEALEHIERRPAMYFNGSLSIELLEAFVLGFMTGAEEEAFNTANGFKFEYFNSWLTGAIPDTLPETIGWRKRIEHVYPNEEDSVSMFFELMKKFSKGTIRTEQLEAEPLVLKWSRGTGKMKLEEFQQIEEIVVRLEIIQHQFSNTAFKIGYNQNDFRVYVEPFIGEKSLDVLRYTEIAENY